MPSPPPEQQPSKIVSRTANSAPSTSARIPQLIHQSWRDGGFPKGLFNWRWQAGLVELNPGWKLVQWTDESSRAFIAKEYPWFLKAYDAYPSYIQRSDAARYFIVHHHGGMQPYARSEPWRAHQPVISFMFMYR